MRVHVTISTVAFCVLAAGSVAFAGDDPLEKDRSDWQVNIYPVFVWAPIFGAHVDLPPAPDNGLPGTSVSTSPSFNGAYAAGAEVLKSGWSAYGDFLWVSVAGDQSNPKAHVGMDVHYGQAMGGYEVAPHWSLEGGVRRMWLKISVQAANSPEVSRNPGVLDPLAGITYRAQLGEKWRFRAHFDGGGFGVGSDVSVGAAIRADWMFARHFGLTFGGEALHFQVTNTVEQKTLQIRQTIYGPIFGLGIYL
jgi:hypothetical protein